MDQLNYQLKIIAITESITRINMYVYTFAKLLDTYNSSIYWHNVPQIYMYNGNIETSLPEYLEYNSRRF